MRREAIATKTTPSGLSDNRVISQSLQVGHCQDVSFDNLRADPASSPITSTLAMGLRCGREADPDQLNLSVCYLQTKQRFMCVAGDQSEPVR